MRDVLVLGSTGSIGRNALAVLDELGDPFRVAGLAASGSRLDRLERQARETGAPRVAVADETAAAELTRRLSGVEVLAGPDASASLVRAAGADIVVAAISGAAGLASTLEAARTGARVALANKEACVAAGHLLLDVARRHGAEIVPVDSEHSALFQSLRSGCAAEVRRLILTASGGPFRTWPLERLRTATVEQALRHPTWDMGRKITIDSATLMNKALEVVEARWLFDLPPERIRVVVHPQSIVHSVVEFRDGSLVAQMGPPDMKLPIRYALTHPDRPERAEDGFDLAHVGSLEFEEPDTERFPALSLGFQAARTGGTAGAVLNAANEAAVELFLEGRLGFLDIGRRVADVLCRHESVEAPDLEEVMRADHWAREEIAACLTP
jgi:1-deoxy-D-xylulose-5-phosphate reductoisomerase